MCQCLDYSKLSPEALFCNMKGDTWFYYKACLEEDIVSVSGTLCSVNWGRASGQEAGPIHAGQNSMKDGDRETADVGKRFLKKISHVSRAWRLYSVGTVDCGNGTAEEK